MSEGKRVAARKAGHAGPWTQLEAAKAGVERALGDVYEVARLDFQALSQASFATEGMFVRSFCRLVVRVQDTSRMPDLAREELGELARGGADATLGDLFFALEDRCPFSERPLVLVIDVVDNASNNQVFFDFLAQLRLQYLQREEQVSAPAFQSVVLAGVTGIKHLRVKIRPEEQHKVNSPWNIATDFDADMSFSANDIVGMLADYETDHPWACRHDGPPCRTMADPQLQAPRPARQTRLHVDPLRSMR